MKNSGENSGAVAQRHGGVLRRGGNHGNSGGKKGRSGRKSEADIKSMKHRLGRRETQAALDTILADPDHPHFAKLYMYHVDRVYGKVVQPLSADVQGDIRVIWE